ncbi:hypothetical protein ACWDV4_20915 [Micromonospora sp. NPDC003197]
MASRFAKVLDPPRLGGEDLPVEFAEAVADGIRRELSGEVEPHLTEPLPGSGPDALAVVAALMQAQWHEVDSNEYGFRRAGRMAVRAAVARLGVRRHDPRTARA